MSSGRVPERGQRELHDVEAVEIRAERGRATASSSRGCGRDDADVDGTGRAARPAAPPAPRTRSSLAWMAAARRARRGRACRLRPLEEPPCAVGAPVKAPRSWPNSSLSSRLRAARRS